MKELDLNNITRYTTMKNMDKMIIKNKFGEEVCVIQGENENKYKEFLDDNNYLKSDFHLEIYSTYSDENDPNEKYNVKCVVFHGENESSKDIKIESV